MHMLSIFPLPCVVVVFSYHQISSDHIFTKYCAVVADAAHRKPITQLIFCIIIRPHLFHFYTLIKAQSRKYTHGTQIVDNLFPKKYFSFIDSCMHFICINMYFTIIFFLCLSLWMMMI